MNEIQAANILFKVIEDAMAGGFFKTVDSFNTAINAHTFIVEKLKSIPELNKKIEELEKE